MYVCMCVLILAAYLLSQQRDMGYTVYSLHLTFGMLVLPEFAPFSHPVYLEAKLVDIGQYSDIINAFKTNEQICHFCQCNLHTIDQN